MPHCSCPTTLGRQLSPVIAALRPLRPGCRPTPGSPRSLRERLGWRSLRRALASIWRIRSRLTWNSLPTSSSVRARPSSRPKRSWSTRRSRPVNESSTAATCSLSSWFAAASAGASAPRSSMKSPRCASPSAPIGVSSETGSWRTLMISRTFSGVTTTSWPFDIASAISSTVGSRPSSWRRERETRMRRLIVSPMWTGMRMVRAWSAIARVIAWRIHQWA